MDGVISLGEAISLARMVESRIHPKAHCGLTGGCLFKGFSSKDIDIIIYSHNINEPYSKEWIFAQIKDIVTPVKETTRDYVDKDVTIADYCGTRVDLFFMP
jgi:hypothetical protein